jgi:hypothetical protein
MRDIRKKLSIIAVAALFLTLATIPATTAETVTEEEQTIPVEITTVAENGLLQTERFQLTSVEWNSLIQKISMLMKLLNMAKGEEAASNILLDFLNANDNPILSRIINGLLSSKMSFKRQLVVSAGWGLNLNPFKKSQTDFIKPITMWHYAEQSNTMGLPSLTSSIDFDPFKLKNVMGSQLGIMLRFRGVYIHLPQPLPQQSFTFFMGTAKHIINLELPSIQLPNTMMM